MATPAERRTWIVNVDAAHASRSGLSATFSSRHLTRLLDGAINVGEAGGDWAILQGFG